MNSPQATISNHRLSVARQLQSSNFDARPVGEISLIVIHGISLPKSHFGSCYVEELFCNTLDTSVHPDFVALEGLRVSSHLFIRRDGQITQFVSFDQRAWHAGESIYQDRENCNDFAIGIELEGTDAHGYEEAQYYSLILACTELMSTYDIHSDAIVGHSDIASGRKTDPGPAFDWSRLRSAVLAQR
jgi:AmpD protein